jgi:MFS family permease
MNTAATEGHAVSALDEVSSAAPPATSYVRYALGLLLIINVLNFVDRQVVTILAEQIKRELQLADWQLGMITGLMFAVFYTLLGIPIARLAERSNRAWIIAISTAVWSAFTAICGAAQSFWQLALARVGVGVGEAGCTPAAHSLISDYVSKEKRASALALYAMGTPLGMLVGLMLGGLVAGTFGWRVTFLVCAAPGLLVAVIAVLTLREPRRQLIQQLSAVTPTPASFRESFRELRSKRAFWWVALAASAMAAVGYGGSAFLPSFFLRNHGVELAALGAQYGMPAIGFFAIVYGTIVGVGGMAGTWMGGYLCDKYGARDARAYAIVPVIGGLFAFPSWICAMLTDSVVLSLALMAVVNVTLSFWLAPVFAAVQNLVERHTRATAAAVLLLVINLIGLGLGPLTLGVLSDLFAGPMKLGAAEGVRWAQIALMPLGLVAIALFLGARKSIRQEMLQ